MLLREEWKINTRKNEETKPKQHHHTVDVTVMEVKSNAVRSNIA